MEKHAVTLVVGGLSHILGRGPNAVGVPLSQDRGPKIVVPFLVAGTQPPIDPGWIESKVSEEKLYLHYISHCVMGD